MISKGDYWREITALNERAAKAEYALAYERHRASLLKSVGHPSLSTPLPVPIRSVEPPH